MTSPYDFNEARQGWRDDYARIDQDPEGDRLAAIAEDRFIRETYSDSQDHQPSVRVYVFDRLDLTDMYPATRPGPWDAEFQSNYNHGQMALDFRMPPAAAVRLVESADDLMLDEGVA
jgi:hypothetical protein